LPIFGLLTILNFSLSHLVASFPSFTIQNLARTHNIHASFINCLFQPFLNGNTFLSSDYITVRDYFSTERNNCCKEPGIVW
jgi:hypothetical protein